MALQHSNSLALSSANGFLVLEGVNGAGKSSLQRTIAAHLYKLGDEVLQTFEPGDTPVGKEIRRLVLSSGRELHPLTELFLFTADRVEHVSEVILPALQAGKRVISDRFTYSTLAFQGYGRDLDLAFISKVNEVATAGCTPDLVILLDVDPLVGLRRNAVKGGADAFEEENEEFQRRLREGFLRIAESSPEPFVVIDASQPLEKVTKEALRIVDEWRSQIVSRRCS